MLVRVSDLPIGASGNIVLSQNLYNITQAYSTKISGNQYNYVTIFTDQDHGFVEGAKIFIRNSSPQINGAWYVTIPDGATGNSFQIPVPLATDSANTCI